MPEPDHEPHYHDVTSVSVGRHSDVEHESTCTSAVQKEVLVDLNTADAELFVRTECNECGTIAFRRMDGVDVDSEEE